MIAAELRRWRDYLAHLGGAIVVVVAGLAVVGIAVGHLILALS